MPLFTPTKASAACSRGSTGSHTPLSPLSSFRFRCRLPRVPVTPSPLRSRPAFVDDSPPTLPYRPTPIVSPIGSPIRSPYSPIAPFPRTPSTPPFVVSPTIASPTLDAVGARERRRELRRDVAAAPPQPASPTPNPKGAREERRESRLSHRPKPSHILASVGSRGARERRRELRLETTPGACDRVHMLLPAKWCPHQVSRKFSFLLILFFFFSFSSSSPLTIGRLLALPSGNPVGISLLIYATPPSSSLLSPLIIASFPTPYSLSLSPLAITFPILSPPIDIYLFIYHPQPNSPSHISYHSTPPYTL